MQLASIPAECTTAVTDGLLAAACAVGMIYLKRTAPASAQRRVWLAALAAFGLSALLGSIVHGLEMAASLRNALWQPLYLLLGISAGLFVTGAIGAWRGDAAARRILPLMLAAAGAFYLATLCANGDFLVFVIFETAALVFAIAIYCAAAAQGRPGAGMVAIGLAISLAAGWIQAAGPFLVQLVWQFDHNGLFHLAQLPGLAFLTQGLRLSLQPRAEEPPEER